MVDITATRGDIDKLQGLVRQLGSQLSAGEASVLSAIFDAGVEALGLPSGSTRPQAFATFVPDDADSEGDTPTGTQSSTGTGTGTGTGDGGGGGGGSGEPQKISQLPDA
jgi:hypothetical protein